MFNTNKKRSCSLVAVAVMVLLPFLSTAQESNLGDWLIYIGKKKFTPQWHLHHEVQYRNYNVVGDLEQLLLRTGIGYDLANNNSVLLGYGFIHSENYISGTDTKASNNEHRIFQQVINKSKIGKVGLQHRYRLEQRFVSEDFKVRFRYFLGLSYPLGKGPDPKFYLSAYNEIFINAQADRFDRNRLYGGLGYKFNKTIKVEAGYMNQFFNSSGRDQFNLLVFSNF